MYNVKTTQSAALLLSLAFLIAWTAFATQPAGAESFNNVQVFATSVSNKTSGFQFAAYNLTGTLIASYQTPYPAAAFELPTGGYLFTASSTSFNPLTKYPCPIMGTGSSDGSGSAAPAMASNESVAVMPIECYPQSSEYGYAVMTISRPQTIDIKMQNVSTLPDTQVTVKASYVNGTAVVGASVYASVVGEYYWWWQNTSIRMGSQTDSGGVAHLVVPTAPAVVTAWKWVPVFTGKNGSTIQATIGGQKVNITVYWQPTYVGLSESGLLLPPQDSISLTLRYQQPDYWVMPAGVESQSSSIRGASAATIASQPDGTPSLASSLSDTQGSNQYYLPSQIPAIQQANGTETTPNTQTGLLTAEAVATGGAAFVAMALVVVLAATRRHRNRPSTSSA